MTISRVLLAEVRGIPLNLLETTEKITQNAGKVLLPRGEIMPGWNSLHATSRLIDQEALYRPSFGIELLELLQSTTSILTL